MKVDLLNFFSGVSSTVRRCLEKATETEFAVKIIDLTRERDNEEITEEMRRETKREIQLLHKVSHHPNISKPKRCLELCINTICYSCKLLTSWQLTTR